MIFYTKGMLYPCGVIIRYAFGKNATPLGMDDIPKNGLTPFESQSKTAKPGTIQDGNKGFLFCLGLIR